MNALLGNLIPGLPTIPFLGNLHLIDTRAPAQSLTRLARDFAGIFRLKLPNSQVIILSTQELVNEVCNEKRFDKKNPRPLDKMRAFVGDALFTARTDEPNWGKAHRILMAAFGPASLREMFPGMLDIAEQLFLKWERLGDGHAVDISDNMTRLTLDTIALAAFGYRFNSFYDKEMHPFVEAMMRALSESSFRARRPELITSMLVRTNQQYEDDAKYLYQISDQLLNERKADPKRHEIKDLLSTMLYAKDPLTGEGLDDANIRNQMVTFLIAGHETTSGLLSFATFALLKNPETLRKARAEVDRVLGSRTPKFEDIAKFTYIDQVLKETLRLWPTAPAFAVHALEKETTLGGRFQVTTDETLLILTPALHRDPKVWNDPEVFDPERMAPDAFNALPPNAWKPFGNGQRGCIGRGFAMQEAILVLAMALQRFDLEFADPAYELKVKETLTLKPQDLFVRFHKRESYARNEGPTFDQRTMTRRRETQGSDAAQDTSKAIPLTILFGSNSGTSEAFAQRIAGDGKAQGYRTRIDTLDSYTGKLEPNGALIIISASYEGQPPDNAKTFVPWLDTLDSEALKELQFSVFGCGNRDWSRTYQAVPKRIDEALEKAGATRLLERGEGDARADLFGDFDRWYERLWSRISEGFGKEIREEMHELSVEYIEPVHSLILKTHQLQTGSVTANYELVDMTKPGARSKRHIELRLPPGTSYRAGDYLSLMPQNEDRNVERALARFGLEASAQIIIRSSTYLQTLLPIDQPLSARDVLLNYVELQQPITKAQIQAIARLCPCPPEKQRLLLSIASDETYKAEILDKRVSLLDLLELNPSCSLSFAQFLQMLPVLKPRQYSISSSPLVRGHHCTLTVAVVEAPAWSRRDIYRGVASQFLANAKVGASVPIMPRASQQAFHLPPDARVPIVLACAGTGLAPFRGFLEERAYLKSQGEEVGEALLFFGCDHPAIDFLYRKELMAWEKQGIVRIRPAFSAAPEGGVSFVQDRIWQDRSEVLEFYDRGAHIYVCGDGRFMAPAVRDTLGRIYQERHGVSDDDVRNWFAELEKNTRYVTDVFS